MLTARMPWRPVAVLINTLFWSILLIVITGGFDYQTTVGNQHLRIDATRPDLLALLLLLLLGIWYRSGRALEDLDCIGRSQRAYVWLSARAGRTVVAATLLAGGLYLLVPLLRHRSFQSGIDLAIFGQAYWNTLQGHFLVSSIHGGMVLWGEHFNPIVLAILPLYRLSPSPETLLVLQSLALIAGAIPLYALARHELPRSELAFVFPLVYLLYLPLRLTNLADFHPIALATPLILATFYFLRRERYGWFLFFCLLTGATKETGPIAVALLGFACGALNRRRLLGGAVVAVAVIWLLVNLQIVIPAFNPAGVEAQLDRYGYLGNSFGEILRTLVVRPLYVLSENLSSRELLYPIRILAPVAFLPLLTPVGLLTLPYFATNILEQSGVQLWLIHYQAELTAFVFLAAIFGAKRVLTSRPSRSLAAAMAAGTLLFFGPSDVYRLREFWPTERTQRLHETLQRIPGDGRVSAQAAIAPHLTRREQLRVFPEVADCDWVIVDYGLDPWPIAPERFHRTVKRLRRSGFGERFDDGRTRIYQAARP